MNREKKEFVSEGLTQVWAWKDAIHREVAHLPLEEALRAIQDKAHAVASKYPQLHRATPLSKSGRRG
jgi:hypothetical protein